MSEFGTLFDESHDDTPVDTDDSLEQIRLDGSIDFSLVEMPEEFLHGLGEDERTIVRTLFQAVLMRYHISDIELSSENRPEIIEQLANTARNLLSTVNDKLAYWQDFVPVGLEADREKGL